MNVAVYCSSQAGLPEQYQAVAKATGEWIGKGGHTLVYGGTNAGLMHIVAQAAHDAGGKVTGVIPERFAPRADKVIDTVIVTTDLSDRKMKMMELADVFVVLPGGIGTIDEWMSALAQIMVNGESDRRGIVAVNIGHIYDAQLHALEEISKSVFTRGKHIAVTAEATSASQLTDYLTKYQDAYEK